MQTYLLVFTNDFRYMFQNNKKLREVKLPPCVKAYGNFMFSNCSALEKVEANADMQYVGTWAFYGCSKLDMVLDKPVNWKYVNERAFNNCTGLKGNLIMPEVESMEMNAFQNTSLSSVTIASSAITEIPYCCFNNNTKLESVDLSQATGLKNIEEGAFEYNTQMTSVVLPEGLFSLGTSAITNSNAVFNIPSTLLHIGAGNNLSCLESVHIDNFTMRGSIITGYKKTASEKKTITELTLPENATIIMDEALVDFTNLQTLNLNDGLRSLGDYNLQSCTALQKLVIPNTVEYIGHNTFNNCSGMTSLTLSSSLKTLGKAFQNCTSLLALTLPESLEQMPTPTRIISGSAFKGCTSLFRVTLNSTNLINNVTYTMFNGCTGISQVIIGNNVETIPAGFLRGLTKVTSVTLPESLKNIDDYAFRDCTGLTSVSIPDNVVRIGKYAFANCTGLETVKLPDNLEDLGTNSFEKCSALQTITIPDKLKVISDFAFNGCDAMSSVTLGSSVERLCWAAFSCKTPSINIPASLKYIDRYNLRNLTDVYITDLAAYCNIDFEDGLGAPDGCKINLHINGDLTKGLYIPEGVQELKKKAFEMFDIDLIEIPTTLKKVGEHAFPYSDRITSLCLKDLSTWCNCEMEGKPSRAENLYVDGKLVTDLVIPNGITRLPNSAFRINNLTSIDTNDVETIGDNCFEFCQKITNVTLGSSLKTIGKCAFDAYGIRNLTVYCDIPPEYELSGSFYDITLNSGCLYVPHTSMKEYANHQTFGRFKTIKGFATCQPEKANSFCNGLNGTIANDATVYSFSHIKDGYVYGEPVTDNVIETGKPYIVVPKEGTERIIFTAKKLSEEPLAAGLSDDNNAMQAVLAEDCDEDELYKTVTGSDYIVFSTQGLKLANSTSGTKIKIGKCYINKANAFQTTPSGNYKAIARYQGDEPLAISNVDMGAAVEAGQAYSVSGTKSNGKGIVVYKGRKVWKKQ